MRKHFQNQRDVKNCFQKSNTGIIHKSNNTHGASIGENDNPIPCSRVTSDNACPLCFPNLETKK